LGLLENRGWRELSVDLESLHRILKHPIRRRIVLELHRRSELTYTELPLEDAGRPYREG